MGAIVMMMCGALSFLLDFLSFWTMPDALYGLNLSFLFLVKSPAAASGLVSPLPAAPRVQVLPFGVVVSFDIASVVSVLINFSQPWILCLTLKGVLTTTGLTGALFVPLGLFFTLLLVGLVGAVLECALLVGVDVDGL